MNAILHALMLLLALQTAQDRQPLQPNAFGGCFIIQGQFIFPPYSDPVHFFDYQLKPYNPAVPPIPGKAGPYDSILMGTGPGDYDLVVELPGFDLVHQLISLSPGDCHPPMKTIVWFDIQLHRSPAIKPWPIAEDTVGIKTLMSKIPNKTADEFEKDADKEAKAGPAETSASMLKILQAAPDYYDANLELGLEYKKLDRQDDSIHALNHALELNDGSMIARSALGEYRFQSGDFKEAARLLGEAVRLGSTSANVYYMLGVSYYKLGQMDQAEASLHRALVIDPAYGNAHLELFNVYMKRNQRAQAVKEAETYLEKNPDAKDADYVRSMIAKYKP